MSSLPVPVSPVMSTEMSVDATLSTLRNTSCIGRLVPTISPKLMLLEPAAELLVVDLELVEQHGVAR